MKPTPTETLPIIRVTRVDSHSCTLVIPGYTARTLAMAHRICATVIDALAETPGWEHGFCPHVERGRHAMCTIVRVGAPGNQGIGDPLLERQIAAILAALTGAADRAASLVYTSHRVGIATYKVEVRA